MRIVLLAGHFPPSPEVGALRAGKVARALVDRGHQVTVIRPAGPADQVGVDRRLGGALEVRTVTRSRSPRDWLRAVKAAIRTTATEGREGPAAVAEVAWQPPTQIGPFKRLVQALMWLPDDEQGVIVPMMRAALDALREGGPGTILYSTSPPHSVQVAALVTQVLTGAPWVVELRDPWSTNPGKFWYMRTGLTDSIERWLERQCLSRSVLAVAVSEGILRHIRTKAGHGAILVRNGIDSLLNPRMPSAEGPFRIVHIGTFYMGRDPRPFLRAVKDFVDRRGLGAADLRVELIGRGEWFNGASMPEFAASLGLGSIVAFVPWLPHSEAEERIRTADLLLLLAEGQPDQIPNKLYEYLGTRRPMLVYADQEGETASMVRAVGGHYLVSSTQAGVDRILEQASERRGTESVGDVAVLIEWTAARQMGVLAEAMEAASGVAFAPANR